MMFPTGMKDQDKPIGFEYIIPTAQFNTLPEAGGKYSHHHKIEVARAHTMFSDLTQEDTAKIQPAVHETHGKVIYFQSQKLNILLANPM
jgi:hypothetical protein